MSFKDIIGQNKPISILQKELRNDCISHAYLFIGPKGIGKKYTAINFAKTMNCLQLDDDCCDQCISCSKINHQSHPDVVLIQPDGQSLKIGQIRRLQEMLSFKPFEGKRKIYIIDEAEKMTREAANALLVTLEEPPPDTVIILIAVNLSMLLPTVISRCQKVSFSFLPVEVLTRILVEKKLITSNKAFLSASLSHGRLDKALGMSDDVFFKRRGELLKSIPQVSLQDIGSILHLAKSISVDRDTLVETLDLLMDWYRDLLLMKGYNNNQFLINVDMVEKLRENSKRLAVEEVQNILSVIINIKHLLERNINLQLTAEVMLMKIAEIGGKTKKCNF